MAWSGQHNQLSSTAIEISNLSPEAALEIYPFIPNGLLYLHSLDWSISNISGVWLVFIITMLIEIHVLNANSVEPDQTPRSAASDRGLLCLPMSLLWNTRLKWVKTNVSGHWHSLAPRYEVSFSNLTKVKYSSLTIFSTHIVSLTSQKRVTDQPTQSEGHSKR